MTEFVIASSVLILIVTVLRHFLKGKISLKLQYALWLLVLARLLLPVTPLESPISVMNAVEKAVSMNETRQSKEGAGPTVSLPSAQGNQTELPLDLSVATETDAAASAVSHPFNGAILATALWIAGVAAVGLSLLLSNLSFWRKLRKTRKKREIIGIPLPVYVVEALPSPCLFGIFRPSIYLTPDVAEEEIKRGHVLAHEITHYRHRDYIWSALRSLCLALHWYNPLVWLAAKLSRRDAELCCDEDTIKVIGEENRMEYGRTLIGLTCVRSSTMDLLCCATTMTDGRKGIKERIVLIAKKPKMLISTFILVLLIGAVAVGSTFTGAKNEKDEIVSLTDKEVEQYNKEFEPMWYDEQDNIVINPLSYFLMSYYDRPEDINLSDFLYLFPSEEISGEKEFEALKLAKNWPFGADAAMDSMPVPIHKFPAETINAALQKYMGISLDDLSGVGEDELIYLKEYDAYYNFTSDFALGTFSCTSGERQGDIVRLYGKEVTLTIKEQKDGFLFVSHQDTGTEKDNSSNSVKASGTETKEEVTRKLSLAMEKADEAYSWFTGHGEIEMDTGTHYFDNGTVWYGIVTRDGISSMSMLKKYLSELFDDSICQRLLAICVDENEDMPLFMERDGVLYCAAGVVGQLPYKDCDWTLEVLTYDEKNAAVTVNWSMAIWGVPLSGNYELHCIKGENGNWRFTDFSPPVMAAASSYQLK